MVNMMPTIEAHSAQPTVANAVGANHSAFSLKLALELFRQPKLWFLSLYVIGVSCTYDVFDQQFPTDAINDQWRKKHNRGVK
jgi:oligosaccharide:H+ symporter